MKNVILTIAFLAVTASAQAQVCFAWPAEGGPLQLVGTESSIQGIDIIDTSGKNQLNRLAGVAHPLPFTRFVAPIIAESNVAQITVGSLGIAVDLDGEVTIAGITVNAGALPSDFQGGWDEKAN